MFRGVDRTGGPAPPGPPMFSVYIGTQLLNGPTQYLTLNSVLMSLEYDLYRSSC